MNGDFFKDRTVLVTGGAGFIGSHVVDRLMGLGANVKVLDHLDVSKLMSTSWKIRYESEEAVRLAARSFLKV